MLRKSYRLMFIADKIGDFKIAGDVYLQKKCAYILSYNTCFQL